MADENKLIQQRADGQRAKRLLDNKLFKEVMGGLRASFLDLMAKSDVYDDEGRRVARIALQCVDMIEKNIAGIKDGGIKAEFELGEMEEMAKQERAAREGFNGHNFHREA